MKVLVTGSEGFIGSHLTELLVQKGFHVIVDKPICKNYSQAKNLVTLAVK